MEEAVAAPALKEIFNPDYYRYVAREMAGVYPRFDQKKFLAYVLEDLDSRNLLQRLRRLTEGMQETLPADYAKTIGLLRKLAPRLRGGFATLFLPDYVGLYGREDFDLSMEALKYFTTFGSSEFAIREFLRRDLARTLRVMEGWSRDENEHVRRLASEGCRPRLPWSFRLEALVRDPSPTARILENLKADPSLYVRKSVANHLNDITKDNPAWVLERLATWDFENPHTAWIAKRALRTLIKKGDPQALSLIGAGEKAEVAIHHLTLTPRHVQLGDTVTLSFTLESLAAKPQRLVIDYAIHYIKKSGEASPKVFKLKELTLAPRESLSITKRQTLRNFTTRTHHAGRHEVEIFINGALLAKGEFQLSL